MGRGYVIEHCVSTLNSIRKEEAFRTYLTEVLRGVSKHLGVEFKVSYNEFLESMKPKKEETRTADEVIDDLKKKAEKLRGEKHDST